MESLHIVSVCVGLSAGLSILWSAKGTSRHRLLGRVYLAAMASTTVGSFWILELRDGALSIFHAVSVFVMLLVVAGFIALRRGNIWLHAFLMMYSLLLTVVTGVAQFFDRLPFSSDALNAIAFLQVPMMVGFALIWRRSMDLRRGGGSLADFQSKQR